MKTTCLRLLLLAVAAQTLVGCATNGTADNGLSIDTAARGQSLAGSACTAMIDDMRWDIVTPATIAVDGARGELRVVCNHPGFRTSELIFRPFSVGGATGSAGTGLPSNNFGGRYPKRLTLDMNPP